MSLLRSLNAFKDWLSTNMPLLTELLATACRGDRRMDCTAPTNPLPAQPAQQGQGEVRVKPVDVVLGQCLQGPYCNTSVFRTCEAF